MGIKITKILSDPSVPNSVTEGELPETDFDSPTPTELKGPRVWVQAGTSLQANRFNPQTLRNDTFEAIKLPWRNVVAQPQGGFAYPAQADALQPAFAREEDPAGNVVLTPQGAQLWTMQDSPVPLTSAFAVLNDVQRAANGFAGRDLKWGKDGQLVVNSDAMLTFNAFYNPQTKSLSFGDYRFRDNDNAVRVGRLISSSDVVRHESGHALHDVLKPNQCDWMSPIPLSFGQWGESFGDQTYMWTALQDPAFADQLVKSFEGKPVNLAKSNILSRVGELAEPVFGMAIRDAVNEFKVSDKSEEVHDRSEVLTGGIYDVFQNVYSAQINKVMHANGHNGGAAKATEDEQKQALALAAQVMGTLQFRTADHTPENFITLKDVALGYLTADAVHFKGAWGDELKREFVRREILTPDDLKDWAAKRKAIDDLNASGPLSLRGPGKASDAEAFLKANTAALLKAATQSGFGLKLQSTYEDKDGRLFIRASLTHTASNKEHVIGNQTLIAFAAPKADGTRDLIDVQDAFPQGLTPADAKKILLNAYKMDPTGQYLPVLTPVGGSQKFDVAFGELATVGPDARPMGKVRYAGAMGAKAVEVDLSGGDNHFGKNPVVP